ncbi:hypothetical protein [Hymenobacter weizhouensis]|uniref:hypothetical protein n=1 Tax=Hymenobacter sp. YIM 151500-1 TaxID=2987689 RepID=UPI0022270ED4|nr:hypothetical protein [Hymenobacter sp. YIM 151500-1]UYZ63460.1 hypothetical protein OIS53_01115 [Hymenobacter sp. YIM 151500-1]
MKYKGGENKVYIADIEKEVIFYACDVLLHQKKQAGRLPSEDILTDIISCVTDSMRELFPNDYMNVHASYAQNAVRNNLSHMHDDELQSIINDYYYKIRNA